MLISQGTTSSYSNIPLLKANRTSFERPCELGLIWTFESLGVVISIARDYT